MKKLKVAVKHQFFQKKILNKSVLFTILFCTLYILNKFSNSYCSSLSIYESLSKNNYQILNFKKTDLYVLPEILNILCLNRIYNFYYVYTNPKFLNFILILSNSLIIFKNYNLKFFLLLNSTIFILYSFNFILSFILKCKILHPD